MSAEHKYHPISIKEKMLRPLLGMILFSGGIIACEIKPVTLGTSPQAGNSQQESYRTKLNEAIINNPINLSDHTMDPISNSDQ